MNRTLAAIAGWSVGVLCCLCVVIGVSAISPENAQRRRDSCVAEAVRLYPELDGSELRVAELRSCRGLSKGELDTVRAQLQNFAIEGAKRLGRAGE